MISFLSSLQDPDGNHLATIQKAQAVNARAELTHVVEADRGCQLSSGKAD
jgi:hypothetical protein